jgi:hypothetical protein
MLKTKTFILLGICLLSFFAKAQKISTVPVYQNYGKVDISDLEMKDCDFEKDANAEVLFDKGVYENGYILRHIRMKIFTQAGLTVANVVLPYNSYKSDIGDFEAETINLNNGKVEITPVAKKSVYNQKINKFNSALSFAFADVRPGSIIEFRYSVGAGPDWYFQSDLPTRYSEIQISFPGGEFNYIPHIDHPFSKNIGESFALFQDKVLTNIHSLPNEIFMGARKDNLERIEYVGSNNRANSWNLIGGLLMQYNEFGGELNRNLKDENVVVNQVQQVPGINNKIAFIFNYVKNNMAWNENISFATETGTADAWEKKVGNSAEINFILHDLLTKAGIKASPMLISTKSNGKLNPFNPNPYSFNNVLVYVPEDTSANNHHPDYILDATNKSNLYNEIPKDCLNTFGVIINKKDNVFKVIFMSNHEAVIQSVYINADIAPQGKMTGTAEITSNSYNKIDEVTKYRKEGEKKFIADLTDNDNTLKVSLLQIQNMSVDTLPLIKEINFTSDLAGSDENYIYFNPNLFVNPHKNPFLSEERFTDIDFQSNNKTLISGSFKLPAGYKVDAVPKSEALTMPDKSIIFRRIINQDDNNITLRYSIVFNKTLYSKNEYPVLREFYKKMYELLNEQIVLKKS